jgi:hypothetical protein
MMKNGNAIGANKFFEEHGYGSSRGGMGRDHGGD